MASGGVPDLPAAKREGEVEAKSGRELARFCMFARYVLFAV